MEVIPVAGIDVGKQFSEMAILSPSNAVYARTRINHDAYSNFEKAFTLLKKAEKEFAAKPAIVMESTGHYHKILFHSLTKAGYAVHVINPIQSDSIRNINVRKVKNDKVDARKVALLYRFEQLKETIIPQEDIDCLRSLCRHYYKMTDQVTVCKNRLTSIVDQVFLNFTDVFKDIFSVTAMAVLENYPTPDAVLKADKQQLITLIHQSSHKRIKWAMDKYELLYDKAQAFQPLSISSLANTAMLTNYLAMIKAMSQTRETALEAIHAVIRQDALRDMPALSLTIDLLCTIPGISTLTAATILAETGDFGAFFKPGKLAAYCGIDPSVKQSGQFTGSNTKMSKRGSRVLRRVLFTTALTSIGKKSSGEMNNPVLNEYYRRMCVSKPKMVALGAVMHKLVFIIYAVVRDRKPFELRRPEDHARMLETRSLAA